jgi:hypothetical protein
MTLTQKNTFKTVALFLLVLSFQYVNAQITLSNIGTTLIKTDMLPCNDDEGWSRVFKLSDFGIAPNEQFIIKSGQIGISNSTISTILYVTVSSVDGDYPDFHYASNKVIGNW